MDNEELQGCIGKVEMPDDDTMQKLSDTFKLFGDPTRTKIMIALMGGGELCVYHLTQVVGASQSAVSHQLRILKAHHLVKSRRDGKNIIYSLDDEHVQAIITMGLKHIEHFKSEQL